MATYGPMGGVDEGDAGRGSGGRNADSGLQPRLTDEAGPVTFAAYPPGGPSLSPQPPTAAPTDLVAVPLPAASIAVAPATSPPCFPPVPNLEPPYEGEPIGSPCRGYSISVAHFWGLDGRPMSVPVTATWYVMWPSDGGSRVGLYPWPQREGVESNPRERQTAIVANNTPQCALIAFELKVKDGVTRRRTLRVHPRAFTQLGYRFGSDDATGISQDSLYGLSGRPEVEWVRTLAHQGDRLTVRLGVSEPLDKDNASRLVEGLRVFTEAEVRAMGTDAVAGDQAEPVSALGGMNALDVAWNGERDRVTLTFKVGAEPDARLFLALVAGDRPVVDDDKLSLGLGQGSVPDAGADPGTLVRSVFLRRTWRTDGLSGARDLVSAAWIATHTMFAEVGKPLSPCDGAPEPETWAGAWRRLMEEEFLNTVIATPEPPPAPAPSPSFPRSIAPLFSPSPAPRAVAPSP